MADKIVNISEIVQMPSAQMEFTPLPSENVESKHILK
jgi:hypothetical protein